MLYGFREGARGGDGLIFLFLVLFLFLVNSPKTENEDEQEEETSYLFSKMLLVVPKPARGSTARKNAAGDFAPAACNE